MRQPLPPASRQPRALRGGRGVRRGAARLLHLPDRATTCPPGVRAIIVALVPMFVLPMALALGFERPDAAAGARGAARRRRGGADRAARAPA